MALAMWALRSVPALLVAPLAAGVYAVVLIALGTFRQPDVALVLQLVPARLRNRLPFLADRP
jgi:hypothetical protein